MLGVGCYNNFQCTPYASNSQCIQGCCCVPPSSSQSTTTVNPQFTSTTTNNALAGLAFCYNGQRTQVRCLRGTDCQFGQTCMQGVCCTTTGQEWAFACAGEAALASCRTGTCNGFVCTTSNYCCECAFGQTSGPCNGGVRSGPLRDVFQQAMP
ncbi:hypothetical protein WR25_20389 [Diploscapter pachys]|uniref:EB domain-containing protein n=1 Tax=Diploscapter pachys TaxID=2018661 RepID=A0A2A2KQQ4_9BILA|nr:hypothetical protein WR25_20389 [Diploscapter pachys]